MQDAEILALLLARDERGMSEFIMRHSPLIRYIIAPILSDEREREECFSDITMKIWEKTGLYSEENGSFKAWVSAVARNTALNRARKNQKETELCELSEEEPARAETPEESLLKKERTRMLLNGISSLSTGEQALFYRKYYYMQPSAQIAAELGTTEKAVETRLYRIKKKLRKILGGELDV